jgi:hypothetical protein
VKGTLAAIAAVGLSATLLVAWMTMPDRAAGPCVVVHGPSFLPDIHEASGLAVSRRTPDVLWSHNDSGSGPILYALDPDGRLLGRVRVPARARDWEDISAARCAAGDCLYIGDIGDNRLARPSVQIYRVPEPAVSDAETAPPDVFNATYADGAQNAEAMFVVDDDLFIVTRDRSGGLYRSTLTSSSSRDLRLERLGQLGLASVTDAETSRDGRSVVVRTSHEAVLYRAADFERGVIDPYLRIPIDGLEEPQGEAVALDGNLLYLASEGRPWHHGGRLVGLRCTFPE